MIMNVLGESTNRTQRVRKKRIQILGTASNTKEMGVKKPTMFLKKKKKKPTYPEGPSTDFISTRGKEVDEVKGVVASCDDLREGTLALVLFQELFLLILAHVVEFLLKSNTEGNHLGSGASFLDPFSDGAEELVCLLDITLLADVDKVNNRLGSEKLELVELNDILAVPVLTVKAGANIVSFLQVSKNLLEDSKLFLEGLIVLTGALLVEVSRDLLHKSEILLEELVADNFEITDRVNITLNMLNRSILKGTTHVVNGIHSANMGEELVAEALSFVSTLDKTSNVSHGENSGYNTLRLVHLYKSVKTGIRDNNLGQTGVNRAEWVVLSSNLEVSQKVEQRGLANVGHANNSHTNIVTGAAEVGLGFRISFLLTHISTFYSNLSNRVSQLLSEQRIFLSFINSSRPRLAVRWVGKEYAKKDLRMCEAIKLFLLFSLWIYLFQCNKIVQLVILYH